MSSWTDDVLYLSGSRFEDHIIGEDLRLLAGGGVLADHLTLAGKLQHDALPTRLLLNAEWPNPEDKVKSLKIKKK